jgi:hypothetical protein
MYIIILYTVYLQQREERLRERKDVVAAVAERGVPGGVADPGCLSRIPDPARSRIQDPDPHQII